MRCSLAHGHASSLWPSSLWQGVGGSKDGTGAWWAARRRTEPFGRLSLKNCEMCVYGTCVVTRLVKSCAYGLVSTVVPDPVECRTSTYPYARRRETSSQSHQPTCVDLTRLQREGRSRTAAEPEEQSHVSLALKKCKGSSPEPTRDRHRACTHMAE